MNRSEEDRLPRIVCEAGGLGVVVGLEGLGSVSDGGHALYRVILESQDSQPLQFRPLIQGGDALEMVAEQCISTSAVVAWETAHCRRLHVPASLRGAALDPVRDFFVVLRALDGVSAEAWTSSHLLALTDNA